MDLGAAVVAHVHLEGVEAGRPGRAFHERVPRCAGHRLRRGLRRGAGLLGRRVSVAAGGPAAALAAGGVLPEQRAREAVLAALAAAAAALQEPKQPLLELAALRLRVPQQHSSRASLLRLLRDPAAAQHLGRCSRLQLVGGHPLAPRALGGEVARGVSERGRQPGERGEVLLAGRRREDHEILLARPLHHADAPLLRHEVLAPEPHLQPPLRAQRGLRERAAAAPPPEVREEEDGLCVALVLRDDLEVGRRGHGVQRLLVLREEVVQRLHVALREAVLVKKCMYI